MPLPPRLETLPLCRSPTRSPKDEPCRAWWPSEHRCAGGRLCRGLEVEASDAGGGAAGGPTWTCTWTRSWFRRLRKSCVCKATPEVDSSGMSSTRRSTRRRRISIAIISKQQRSLLVRLKVKRHPEFTVRQLYHVETNTSGRYLVSAGQGGGGGRIISGKESPLEPEDEHASSNEVLAQLSFRRRSQGARLASSRRGSFSGIGTLAGHFDHRRPRRAPMSHR